MIERKFIKQNMMEHRLKEFVSDQLKRAGLSDVKFQRTPLGEKIVIYASRPGLVVGRGGSNIAQLTKDLKKKFDLENPQVEIEEITNPHLDPNIVAEMIANSLERFGPTRFKGIGYRALNDAMESGARGVEIVISGRVPSSRARNWRFYAGYLKKCGDTALTGVDSGFSLAVIKAGAVGVKVKIMPPDVRLPDDIKLISNIDDMGVEEVSDEEVKDVKEEAEKAAKKPKKEKKEEKAEAEKEQEKKEDSDEELPARSTVKGMTKDEIKDYAKEEFDVELSTNDLKKEMIDQLFKEVQG